MTRIFHFNPIFYINISIFLLFFNTAYAADDLKSAKLMMLHHRYEKASEILEKIVAEKSVKDKNLPLIYYHLVQSYIVQKKINKAEEVAQKVMQILPSAPFSMLSLGSVLMMRHQEEEARPLFENALQQARNKKPEVLVAYIRAYAQSQYGNAEDVFRNVEALPEKFDKTSDFFVALADLYKRERLSKEVYTNYHLAVLKKANNLEARYKLGRFHLQQGNTEGFLDNMDMIIKEDKSFAPAYHELYVYYYPFDVKKSRDFFMQYKEHTDFTPSVAYEEVSIFYAARDYEQAIEKAQALIAKEKGHEDIRSYRLIGYSYSKLKDKADEARRYMDTFFMRAYEEDSSLIQPLNYRVMGDILKQLTDREQEAVSYYKKGFLEDTVFAERVGIANAVLDIAQKIKDTHLEADWMGLLCSLRTPPAKSDLFRWGIASLKAERYEQGDSIFTAYVQAYPNEYFGYFWSARAKLYMDTSMVSSVPLFLKTVEIANANDSSRQKYKSVIIQCYQNLYTYEVEKNHDLTQAISYLDSLVSLMENQEAIERCETTKKQLLDYIEKQKQYEEDMRKYEEQKRKARQQQQ